jgi:hypothetical protein
MNWTRFYIVIFSIVFLQTTSFALDIPSQESANNEQFCTQESSKRGVLNKEDFNWCMQGQVEGYKKIVDILNKYGDNDWIESALNDALKSWTKKGLRDDNMVAADLEAEIDAYEDLAYEYKQSASSKNIIDKCWSQYKNEWILIRNCFRSK